MLIYSVSLLKRIRRRRWQYFLEDAYVVLNIAANLRSQIEIFHVLASPAYRKLAFIEPRFPFRYAISDYLARGLNAFERARCLLCHYRHLQATLPAGLLIEAFEHGITIYEEQRGDSLYSIVTSPVPSKEYREGELCLELRSDGVQIYVLQFTVVPGPVVGSQARHVILISRIQGVRGCYPLIQSTTKAFHDVAPPALLVGALHGLAQVLGIDEWAGVTSEKQTCFGLDHPDMFNTAYDDFFTRHGGTLSAANFFLGHFSERKPLERVNNGHKARKKKRRAIRLQVASDVARLIFSRRAEFSIPPRQSVPNRSVKEAASSAT